MKILKAVLREATCRDVSHPFQNMIDMTEVV